MVVGSNPCINLGSQFLIKFCPESCSWFDLTPTKNKTPCLTSLLLLPTSFKIRYPVEIVMPSCLQIDLPEGTFNCTFFGVVTHAYSTDSTSDVWSSVGRPVIDLVIREVFSKTLIWFAKYVRVESSLLSIRPALLNIWRAVGEICLQIDLSEGI